MMLEISLDALIISKRKLWLTFLAQSGKEALKTLQSYRQASIALEQRLPRKCHSCELGLYCRQSKHWISPELSCCQCPKRCANG